MTNLQNAFSSNADALDLLFAQRNKAYGAYDLRRHYNQHVRKATAITLLLLCCFIAIAFWSRKAHLSGKKYKSQVVNTFVPITIKKEPPKPIKPIAPPKQIAAAQSRYQAVKPVDDQKVTHDTSIEMPKYNAGKIDIAPTNTNTQGAIGIADTGMTNAPIPEPVPIPDPKPDPIPDPKPPQAPILVAEQMPEFIGGTKAMIQYIQKNLQYPLMARESDISGTVAVRFVVNEDGSISNIEVLRGIGGGCDQEAISVVKNMPTWKPGKQNGKPVKVYFTLPIKFKLE